MKKIMPENAKKVLVGTVKLRMYACRKDRSLTARLDSDVHPRHTLELLLQGMNAAFLKMKGSDSRKADRFLNALEMFAPELFNALAEIKT